MFRQKQCGSLSGPGIINMRGNKIKWQSDRSGTIGDEIPTKPCKPVKEMNERTIELIEDMFETMYESNGCGLAAPQVGVRKRIVVIDVG